MVEGKLGMCAKSAVSCIALAVTLGSLIMSWYETTGSKAAGTTIDGDPPSEGAMPKSDIGLGVLYSCAPKRSLPSLG